MLDYQPSALSKGPRRVVAFVLAIALSAMVLGYVEYLAQAPEAPRFANPDF
jgi:hypothetical protein